MEKSSECVSCETTKMKQYSNHGFSEESGSRSGLGSSGVTLTSVVVMENEGGRKASFDAGRGGGGGRGWRNRVIDTFSGKEEMKSGSSR
jgi:hypothetical protein